MGKRTPRVTLGPEKVATLAMAAVDYVATFAIVGATYPVMWAVGLETY